MVQHPLLPRQRWPHGAGSARFPSCAWAELAAEVAKAFSKGSVSDAGTAWLSSTSREAEGAPQASSP